jgi:uncharacterized BrkB/YihY/UPF0761 family membrane protein
LLWHPFEPTILSFQTKLTEYSFVPFAVILTVLFALLFFYLPETKGLQVSDIVAIFQVPHAWSVFYAEVDFTNSFRH